MNDAAALRRLLAREDRALLVPGGATPIEALAIERAGFDAMYLSGYAIAAWRHGLPDIGLLGAGELLDALNAVRRVSSLPIMVDADTGYGDVTSVYANVRLLEDAGAAAIQIEDQVWPKKCGHMLGKEVIDADDAVRKVATALDARRDPDTVIIARTDALGPRGIDEALARALRFADAGADVVFVDAPGSREDLARIGATVPGLSMVNVSEGGRTPTLPASEFYELGFAVIIYPTTLLRSAVKTMEDFLADLHRRGDSGGWRERMHGLDELNDVVRLEDYLVVGDRENNRHV